MSLLKEIIYTPVSLVKGLWVTFVNFFRRKVTLQYPDQRWQLPENYRGVPALPTLPGTIRILLMYTCQTWSRLLPITGG